MLIRLGDLWCCQAQTLINFGLFSWHCCRCSYGCISWWRMGHSYLWWQVCSPHCVLSIFHIPGFLELSIAIYFHNLDPPGQLWIMLYKAGFSRWILHWYVVGINNAGYYLSWWCWRVHRLTWAGPLFLLCAMILGLYEFLLPHYHGWGACWHLQIFVTPAVT